MSGGHSWHAARAAEAMQEISDALAVKPMSRTELMVAVSHRKPRLGFYVRRMHQAGMIHIVQWLKQPCGHGAFMAVFATGPGADVPRPKPKTKAQMAKEARRKIKSDPARRVDYLQKARARETRRGRKVVKPDAFLAQFAGLFGNKTQQEAA